MLNLNIEQEFIHSNFIIIFFPDRRPRHRRRSHDGECHVTGICCRCCSRLPKPFPLQPEARNARASIDYLSLSHNKVPASLLRLPLLLLLSVSRLKKNLTPTITASSGSVGERENGKLAVQGAAAAAAGGARATSLRLPSSCCPHQVSPRSFTSAGTRFRGNFLISLLFFELAHWRISWNFAPCW